MSIVETPLLPQALDAEEALLGAILIDPEALLVARSLTPADFYREAHATLFATMRQLEEDGLAVDVITVTTRLERTGQLERAGGASYILGLVNAVPTSQNARYYAQLVKQAADGRKVLQVAGDLANIGYYSTDPANAAARAVETLVTGSDAALDLTPEEARARLAALAPSLIGLDELMRQTFPETVWVVPDLLSEGLTLLAAKPKLGKSWLALGLALAVSAGTPALGGVPVKQGAVLYLALEDSFKRLRARARLLLRGPADDDAATLELPHALEVITEWPRLDQGGLGLLKMWLQASPDARLIIVDTLAKIRGQARSATLYGDDYASLEDVQKLAHAHGVAILVVHHTGKESREDPLDEVNATQGLNGVADNVLVLRRERGKQTATLIGDGRELTGSERALLFDINDGGWRLTEAPADQPKTPERAEILDLLKASDEPLSPKQIAEALGKTVDAVRHLLPKMVQSGEITMVSYGKYLPTNNIAHVAHVAHS